MARKNAHQTVEMLCEFPMGNKIKNYSFKQNKKNVNIFSTGAQAVIDLKLIKTLVEKLKSEFDEIKVNSRKQYIFQIIESSKFSFIKEIILDTLHFCMMIETQQALDAKAMVVFTDLLSNKAKSIKAKTARDVFDLW
jgi:hypothetical protein